MKQQDYSEEQSVPKKNRRCKYQKISQKMREEIIDRLCIKKEGLREVAAKLKINHSTCKAIVKVYESQGRIGKKKTRNRNIDVVQTFTFCVVNKGTYQEIPDVKLIQKRVSCSRGEDIDKMLSETAKTQSEEIAGDMLTSRKRMDQIWQQHLQSQVNSQICNYQTIPMPMYYYGAPLQQSLPTVQSLQNMQILQEVQIMTSMNNTQPGASAPKEM